MDIKPVTVRNLPYTIMVHKDRHRDAEAWCRAEWGERWSVTENKQGTWCCFWGGFREAKGNYLYHFAREQDAIVFALRWA